MQVTLEQNLTPKRLGMPDAKVVRLLFMKPNNVIHDVMEGPPRWIIRKFNINRGWAIEDGCYTAILEDHTP